MIITDCNFPYAYQAAHLIKSKTIAKHYFGLLLGFNMIKVIGWSVPTWINILSTSVYMTMMLVYQKVVYGY